MLCACKRRQLPRKDEMSAGAGAQIQPSLAAIREAQKFLAQYFAETRLIAGPFLSQRTAKNVYLKLETELPTASFKVRGAFYALAQRMKKEAVREVIASSTGNHGAAVAYAAKEFGIAARIFLPANCNPVKRGGIAAAAKQVAPQVRIIGVQAERAAAYYLSWKQGRVVGTETCDTIADGLATRTPEAANVRDVRALVDDVVLVSEEQMLEAIAIL